MIEQKSILLSEIKPDTNQPRKFYDESAMAELIESVKSKGILQPILIRPNGKGYILVCGERRFKAATAAGMKDIPAVIREMTPEEALELQIIENLQRKDVHPMEEAVAFKSLIEKGKDSKEIATRVGKNEYYVNQRMKLNSLSKEWQEAFFAHRTSMKDALKIAVFEESIQQKLYKRYARGGKINIGEWELREYRGDLMSAPFSLDDTTLDKKMGACTSCQFNTATAKLFKETENSSRCTNVSCYKNKCGAHFLIAFESALLEPGIVFVHDEYSSDFSDKFIARVKKDGHPVYTRNGYDSITPPESPDHDDWLDDNDEIEGLTPAEIQSLFEKDEVTPYKKRLKEYNDKVAGGKYKKAFMLSGDDRGKIIFITLRGNAKSTAGSTKVNKEKESEGKLTVADIDAEIQGIKDREVRNKQLDIQKIHIATLDALKDRKEFEPDKPKLHPLQTIDRGIMIYLLLESAGMTGDSIKGLPEPDPKISYAFDEKYFEALSKVSDETLALVIRVVAMDKYGNRNLIYGIDTEDTIMRLIARYIGINLPAIELAQNEIAINRKERVDKRIKALQDKKKELNTKPAAKKATVKKK